MSRIASGRTAVPNRRGPIIRLRRHENAPDPSDLSSVREWVARCSRPRAIDLFCGAGGLSLGLHDAGFDVLVGADADRWAVETHTANLGGLGYVGDLTDPTELIEQLSGWGVDHVDLVAGGVPCQPFSRAGQAKIRELIRAGERHPQDHRALLWRSFMQVVEVLSPDAVLVENVPDLPSWDGGSVLSGFLESLGELGYTVDARVLDAYRYGVPQHRSRLLLCAFKGGREMEWPDPADEITTLRDAIGDLPPVPGGQREKTLAYRPRPNSASTFQARMRAGLPGADSNSIDDHITRNVRPDDWEAFVGLGPGQTYADVPPHLQRYRTDIFTDKYKRLSWDELSRTITAHIAKDGYWYIHPEQHRTLSIREAARLQTFPDHFKFAGQPSHRYAQIGNAVPPFLARAVGDGLLATLAQDEEVRHHRDQRHALVEWHAERLEHPWRRVGADPWLVLAAELTIDQASSELQERFASLAALCPDPLSLQRDPHVLEGLRAAGFTAPATDALAAASSTIEEFFGGIVPSQDLELRAIPRVGESTSKMVLTFGFGRKVVPLHSAAARVAARVTGRSDRRRWQLRLDLHRLAGPDGPDARFNSAVIALGTEICRPVSPNCAACPLRERCASAEREMSAAPQEVLFA